MYSIPQTEQIAIIKKLLGRKGLQFLELLTQAEQERYNTMEHLLATLNNKLKPQYNGIIKSLQFHKVGRQTNDNEEESMSRLRLAAVECNYKEIDWQSKEQFIHELSDNDMLAEIIRELTKAKERTAVTSEQVLIWAKRVEAHRAKSAIRTSLSETKEFDKIRIIKRGTEMQSEKTTNMCQKAHKTELQLLWFQPSTKTMPSPWEEVCGVWQDQPL